jgi:predicted N-acyltransferase
VADRRLRAEIYDRIADVPGELWDRLLAGQHETLSREFWAVLEASDLNDFDYRYVLFFDAQGEPAGLSSFYNVTTDIAIFAAGTLRTLLNAVRRHFPNFLKLRMLECGTPITITSPPFVRRADISDDELVAALHEVLRSVARRERQFLIVVRDFEPESFGLETSFRRHGYHWTGSLPNTYIENVWDTPEAYLGAMRSYFRSKLRKHLRRNVEAGVTHRLVEDFAELADTLHRQWMVVHDSAKEFQREVLTPAFYRHFAQLPGAKALLFHRHGVLAGHALLMQDGEMLRWLYVGRDVAGNDSLYLYVAQKVVETAIQLGARRVEMGLTTYPIKQDLGAVVTPIRLALRARSGFINVFVGLGYRLLNDVPSPAPRQIFKDAAGEAA